MCKQHALRIAWTIARSIAFLDFRVLRWKFTYDWKCVNTTYRVPLFCPLPASRKGLRLTLRSALFGEGGRDWRPWVGYMCISSLINFISAPWLDSNDFEEITLCSWTGSFESDPWWGLLCRQYLLKVFYHAYILWEERIYQVKWLQIKKNHFPETFIHNKHICCDCSKEQSH